MGLTGKIKRAVPSDLDTGQVMFIDSGTDPESLENIDLSHDLTRRFDLTDLRRQGGQMTVDGCPEC